MRVLVIDDETFMLKLLSRQLAQLGFEEVIPFEMAQDALDHLKRAPGKVDWVFCDLQMPEMDGIEFVRHLARSGYTGRLVLVSGEDSRILFTAEKLALAHGLDILGTLHKPVTSNQLQGLVDLGSSRAAPVPRTVKEPYGPDALRWAIAGGELVNHYQPKVHLASGKVAGVEALVRWQHPQDGLIFPDQFIATAEANGLIDDLTRKVLGPALRQLQMWQDAGLTLHMAVNVSMDSLGALEFPDFVACEVSHSSIFPGSLTLELTESRLMKDHLASFDILTRLSLKHIGLSIDDFGTGHSSLSQLLDIPFDELKVDQGFVHGAFRQPTLKAIFDASLGMAKRLGMRTVAEGVEDRADWEFVRASGCDLAQGYFIGRPMPAASLPGWIDAWRATYQSLVAPPRCALLRG